MIIAILLALGVTAGGSLLLLIVLTLVKRFKRIKNPADFRARVRLVEGQFPGVGETWKRRYGAWVTDVLTVRRGRGLNIAGVLPVAHVEHIRKATPDDARGLGDCPAIAALTLRTGARLELAVPAAQRAAGLTPWEVRAAGGIAPIGAAGHAGAAGPAGAAVG